MFHVEQNAAGYYLYDMQRSIINSGMKKDSDLPCSSSLFYLPRFYPYNPKDVKRHVP